MRTTERDIMNRLARFIVAATIILCPVVAGAQGTSLGWGNKAQTVGQSATNPQGALKVGIVGGVASDSTARPFRFDANGNAYVTESNPLGSQTSGFLLLISDTTAVGMADSSAVQTAYPGYILHGLYIRASLPATVPSAANAFCRIALSVRTHLNGLADSVSTAPVYISRATSGVDSTKYGVTTQVSTTQISDAETIVYLVRQAQNMTVPGPTGNGATNYARYIPLADQAGNALRLQNFSVLERVLSANANTNTVTVYAYCTVLR